MILNLDNLQKAWNNLEEFDEFNIQNNILEYKKGGKTKLVSKKKPKIYIKKKNRGKFTESAKRAGKSVQAYANQVLNDPNATPLQKKRANFAKNAKKWNHGKR